MFLDAFSGIAGDMSIAALVDLGVPFTVIEAAVAALDLGPIEVRVESTMAGAIGATRLVLDLPGGDGERTHRVIDDIIARSSLSPDVRALARRIFRRLAEAEAEVHRMPVADVHFHEVGALDAIVDIVGAAAAFSHLGAEVICSPLPMGHGMVDCRHGRLPLPAPATVACLRGIPTYDAGIEAELVTPTGAAIVAGVAQRFARWPAMTPEHIGWGRGHRELPDRPNALRVVLGASAAVAPGEEATYVVLEANVDDMTGELAGHAIAALIGAGARDAWASPITMKKGRPGLIVSALAERHVADAIAEVLLRETSSIGLRRTPAQRLERPRRSVDVETRYGVIPVKVAEGPFGPPQLKPEFDVCAERAAGAGVPVREVVAEALVAARAQLRT